MLHDFLTSSRTELIERCRVKVALRSASQTHEADVAYGIPHFIDQLIATLRLERDSEYLDSETVSGAAGGATPATSEIGMAAAHRGRELSERGFSIDQVVHEYGDLCQAITNLASESAVPIEVGEFRSLNRCLDNAIADAVKEFTVRSTATVANRQRHAFNEQLGVMAHELRNHLQTATLVLDAIKSGRVPLAGATSAVLDRSLIGMRGIIDDCLVEVRVAEASSRRRRVAVSDLIDDLKVSAALQANARGVTFDVSPVDPQLTVEVDRELVSSALQNVLQNAFKFTRSATHVRLHAYGIDDRVRIAVEDHCGGLSAGDPEELFVSFKQRSVDRSGLGLGLAISRAQCEANGGTLTVRDKPGCGCVFTIDMARCPSG
ncbi:MAG: HAMP domain-containing histidine kinase [Pseudomonadota bacterium]|nr:HAMP domain-containing histidine kinase [Pseudomonadota bacterium]